MTCLFLIALLCLLCGAAGYFLARVELDSGLLKVQPAVLFNITLALVLLVLIALWRTV